MPVRYLLEQIQYPEWAGIRYRRLDGYQRFLEGNIYDHLRYPFYYECDEGGTYIPLRERRPSVIYNIPRVVVSRSVSLLFGDKHWPQLHTSDESASKFLRRLESTSCLQASFIEAATLGSLGSVAVLFTIDDGKFYYEVWNPKFCYPLFDRQRDLEELLLLVPTFGYDLAAVGYRVDPEDQNDLFFFAKRITKTEEILYLPVKCDEYEGPESLQKDAERSFSHGLGFVPGVWIKNFPCANGLDSDSTFQHILNLCVEIDYQLSQAGRGLKYNADPQLFITEPAGSPNASEPGYSPPIVRSPGNAIIGGEESDAKLLEITGQGQKTVIEFVKLLRQYALEVARGSHKDPEQSYGNMSGRAMEILDEDLIGLSAALRVSYGEHGLKCFLHKVLRAAKKLDLCDCNPDTKDFSLELIWGNWFDPTPADLLQSEQALDLAVKGYRIFEPEARQLSAGNWGVGQTDPEELAKEWPRPPEPQVVKDEKEIKKKPERPPGAGGRSGRDSKVTA